MLVDYLATGSYGVWPDIKLKNSKLNTPNIVKALVPLTLSLALIVSSILTCLGGKQNAKVRLDAKNIYYGKSTAYFVHTDTGYQFHVSSDAYYRMQIGSCYSFTFYMAQGVLTYFHYDYLITNIAQAAC